MRKFHMEDTSKKDSTHLVIIPILCDIPTVSCCSVLSSAPEQYPFTQQLPNSSISNFRFASAYCTLLCMLYSSQIAPTLERKKKKNLHHHCDGVEKKSCFQSFKNFFSPKEFLIIWLWHPIQRFVNLKKKTPEPVQTPYHCHPWCCSVLCCIFVHSHSLTGVLASTQEVRLFLTWGRHRRILLLHSDRRHDPSRSTRIAALNLENRPEVDWWLGGNQKLRDWLKG